MAATAVSGLLISCAKVEIAPHLRPLSGDAMMLLGKKGMNVQAPIFIRVYKEESELEVWKLRDDGRYYHYKTYPICTWSGELGPKQKAGDKQAPEGFYTITREQMNPDSRHYLAFNLGYPNAYDKAQRRSGDALMVHGKCKSVGCYAMTDALIEEIYALARDSFLGPNDSFQVQVFPFRMTAENIAERSHERWLPFWANLKRDHDLFEQTRVPPRVSACKGNYSFAAAPARSDGSHEIDNVCMDLTNPKG